MIDDLSMKSLFLFSKDNLLRKFLIKLVLTKWFDTFIVATIILNTIILGIYDYNDNNPSTWRNDINTYTEPVFTSIFTLECLIKIIAYGFIFGKNTYLKDKWNWIDFLVVLTSLMSIFPQFDNYSAFRTFRLLRPLRSLNSMQKMKLLVSTLLSSLSQLGEIMLFSMFFFLIFAIMGVSFWAGNIHYRCRTTQYPVNGDWVANQYDTQLWGDRSCPYSSDLSINTYCGSLVEAHDVFHNVTVSDVYRDTKIPDLNFGLVTFDNVMISILTIYQCITTEGWTMIMYYYSGSFSPVLTHIVFISMIIVCSFFLLNLTIAILLDKYAESEVEDGGLIEDSLALHDAGREAKLPPEVINFIIHQDITSIKKKSKSNLSSNASASLSSSGKSLSSNLYDNFWVTFINSEIIVPQTKYYKFKITRWMYYLAMHPLFNSFILLMIVFNTILLAFERYPEPPQSQQDLFADFNIAFIAIFGLEVVIKLVALGIKDFVRDKFNMFDALVVVISLVEVSLSGSSSLSALRSFRLFRIFKIFRVGDLRVLLDSITVTIMGMGYYTILLGLFMYIFTLLGMQLFAGNLAFGDDSLYNPNGVIPRENFDSFWEAFLTVFIMMIGDGWNNIMYNGMLSQGNFVWIYHCLLYAFGSIIMINLFLAILLSNFDSSRQLMAKNKAFDELK